jgi:alpha-glucosidase
MMKDMENILDTYRDWGVKGIKIDFMQMNDQNMVNFYEDVARECFERHLLVDYHGAFKPAGLQRKYPNAMTYEGVYGMEHDKCSYDISPEHDLVLPFTRMVAGPMDYTPGATINASKTDFRERWEHPMSQGTRAHQAAIFVAFESPLMMMCDSPSNYRRNEEYARFLASIPTVWDETVALDAKAGDYLLMARRNGDTWYVAGLNDWNGRKLEVTLDFLGEGEYDAQIFMDGVNADSWGEDYKLERTVVRKGDVLPVRMADGGGWAAILKPVK